MAGARPYDLLVTGVGGTGVVTVGAVIAMAAHLEGKSASVLDFMGFAQKGGAVLSFVRLADAPERLNQVRIDTPAGRRDPGLRRGGRRLGRRACRPCATAAPASSPTCTRSRWPSRCAIRTPTCKVELLLEKMRFVAGEDQVETFDAQTLAEEFLGDTLASNILATGYAWQRGLMPLSLEALMRAIELNGVAVAANQIGLLARPVGRRRCRRRIDALRGAPAARAPQDESLDALVARGMRASRPATRTRPGRSASRPACAALRAARSRAGRRRCQPAVHAQRGAAACSS